jgi:hypothetical protein
MPIPMQYIRRMKVDSSKRFIQWGTCANAQEVVCINGGRKEDCHIRIRPGCVYTKL